MYLRAGDRSRIERLVGYMTRCPFSLSRLVKVIEMKVVAFIEPPCSARLPFML